MENSSHLLPSDNFYIIKNQLMQYIGGSVTLTKDEATQIAYVCISHPEKRNGISGAMAVQFEECITVLEEWKEGKAVIVYSRRNNVCYGSDFDCERTNETNQEGLKLVTWMHDLLNRLQKLPLISVCVVQGLTLGGGAEISVSCDYIIAVENVKYGFVHGVLGVSPGWACGLKLVNKVGQRKALDLLLTSKILNAQECVDFGIAEIIVPISEALDKTVAWLKTRLIHNHAVTRSMKALIVNSNFSSFNDALERAMHTMLSLWEKGANKAAIEKNIKHLSNK